MAYSWDFSDNDMNNTGVWARSGFGGGAADGFVIDLWDSTGTPAMLSDGTSDQIQASSVIGTSDDMTGAIWVNFTATPGSSSRICEQRDSGTNGYDLSRDGVTGDIALTAHTDGSNRVLSRIAHTLVLDQGWVQLAWTIEKLSSGEADIVIYVNAVETTYQFQNFKTGSGFTGFTNTDPWCVGRFPGASFPGTVSRSRGADDVVFTQSQITEQYDDEVAAQLSLSNIQKIYPETVIDDKIVGNLIMKNIYKQ